MRAMILEKLADAATKPLRLVDAPLPAPAEHEILVRVRACGVCRTDLHVIEGDLAEQKLPIVPGHQVVGTVERCGAGARRFAAGSRVGIAWLRSTCGVCRWCQSGRENLCPSSRYTGWHADGGYAEYAFVDERFAYAIPDEFSDAEAAPLMCAGIIGYRALELAEVPPGGTLALFGFGSSAHIVLRIARHRGHRVFVSTRGESHQRLALDLGAEWAGATLDVPPEPVDSAIVFAPAGEIVPVAMRALAKGGTCALAGIHMTPVPSLDYESCLFHEKKLRSVEANTRNDGEGLLREAAAAGIRPRVTTFALEDANEALVRLKTDRIDGSAVLVMS
ncbi:MAG TPA: zinc-dependent alcohol dehydrogenase family protein [Candidatus Limnocylindrales bacterium]|nr:zinc-dependent alcohol dehydrogenase family protein [Candidatus Limnocylindrales bacterium]